MAGKRDLYSHLGFFNALRPQATAITTEGATINIREFDQVAMVVEVNSFLSLLGSVEKYELILEHATVSVGGVDQWSVVPNSLLIHSVQGGLKATGETGIFETINSASDIGTYFVGYRGDANHGYLRLKISATASETLSVARMVFSGTAVLGSKHLWPVNVSVT